VTIDILALVIAVIAIVITTVQFLTGSRPYVCVTSLRLLTEDTGGVSIEIELSNLGEVPAREAHMTAVVEGGACITKRSIGAVFPNQNLKTVVGVLDSSVISAGDSIGLCVDLTYRAPFSFGWRRFGYGIHYTSQPLYVDETGWGAWAGKKAAFR
jgi:hypothetical protein